MLCKDCLERATNKLLANDVAILEYLHTQKATIPQCSISREIIRDEMGLTSHKCFSALERLDCFGFVEKSNRHKASKYHITETGIEVLTIFEKKISEVS